MAGGINYFKLRPHLYTRFDRLPAQAFLCRQHISFKVVWTGTQVAGKRQIYNSNGDPVNMSLVTDIYVLMLHTHLKTYTHHSTGHHQKHYFTYWPMSTDLVSRLPAEEYMFLLSATWQPIDISWNIYCSAGELATRSVHMGRHINWWLWWRPCVQMGCHLTFQRCFYCVSTLF